MGMKKINLYLTEEQLRVLEAEKERLGIPIAEQIRRAIDAKIEGSLQRSKLNEGKSENN